VADVVGVDEKGVEGKAKRKRFGADDIMMK